MLTSVYVLTYFRILFLFGGEPMHSPYFAEHGAVRERESGRQKPRTRLANLRMEKCLKEI